jgi:hypothetical protein
MSRFFHKCASSAGAFVLPSELNTRWQQHPQPYKAHAMKPYQVLCKTERFIFSHFYIINELNDILD